MCLSDVVSFVSHGANGVCGPPSVSIGAALLFVLGVLGTLALWRRRARSAIFLCVLFALPGWAVLARRHVDEEPVTRLRVEIEKFTASHDGCVELSPEGCETCDPIARRARTPSHHCEHPGIVELHDGALGGHCVVHGERLVCGPN